MKGLKVADLSVCPDNVGCNTYSTALLIGEKAAMLTGEDLGYSGAALNMTVCASLAVRSVSDQLTIPPGSSVRCAARDQGPGEAVGSR